MLNVFVSPLGTVHFVYDERLDLTSLGRPTIQRASHVEPDSAGGWIADLSPVNGPQLGPFAFRSQALAAERDWLDEHWRPSPKALTTD
jgi:hypothetical protein